MFPWRQPIPLLPMVLLAAAYVPTAAPAAIDWRQCLTALVRRAGGLLPPPPAGRFRGLPAPISELKPKFTISRGNARPKLVEAHSGVQLWLDGDFLEVDFYSNTTQQSAPRQESLFLRHTPLRGEPIALLKRVFKTAELSNLSPDDHEALTIFFRSVVCPLLFAHQIEHIFPGATSQPRLDLYIPGLAVWPLTVTEVNPAIQIEWSAEDPHRSGTTPMTPDDPQKRYLIQVLFDSGLAEIRIFSTQTESEGYQYLTLPLSNLLPRPMGIDGLVRQIVVNYDKIVQNSIRVEDSVAHQSHAEISRAFEIGLDPRNGYRRIDYLNRELIVVAGSFSGRRATATEQSNVIVGLAGGYRSDLTLCIPGVPCPVVLPSNFVLPVDYSARSAADFHQPPRSPRGAE